MKKLLFAFTLALALVAGAKDQYDIRPSETAEKAPTAAEWQQANRDALAAATAPEKLAAFVATPEAAEALLAKVKPAYATEPMDAMRVAAVTQYVMSLKGGAWWQFWAPSMPAGRRVWIGALLKAAEDAKDAYVCEFCLDQLRWCGCKCQVPAIAAIGAKSSDKGVKDVAAIAVKELSK